MTPTQLLLKEKYVELIDKLKKEPLVQNFMQVHELMIMIENTDSIAIKEDLMWQIQELLKSSSSLVTVYYYYAFCSVFESEVSE